jgi:hypothetical protein
MAGERFALHSRISPDARELDHVAIGRLDHHLCHRSWVELQIGENSATPWRCNLLMISSITFIRRAVLAVSSVIGIATRSKQTLPRAPRRGQVLTPKAAGCGERRPSGDAVPMYQTPAHWENVTGRGAFLTAHERLRPTRWCACALRHQWPTTNHCFVLAVEALFAIAKASTP